jgi:predicted GIY-YIG superfamily endonuclease
VRELQDGSEFRFADWPVASAPRLAAGVYTIWRGGQFIYAGMSGDLWKRLNSHASGRRGGDQFNIYVCDRFVVPVLTPAQQGEISRGELLLDRLTRDYIRDQLTYRFVVCLDGAKARELERAVRAGQLPAGRPFLNPLVQPDGSRTRRSGR